MHAADLHLDSPFRGMAQLPSGVRDRIRVSTFEALDAMVETAIHERVAFIVISGDIYDLSDSSLKAQLRFQKAMEKLSKQGISVFAIHGNHDPENGRRAELHWPNTVHFFSSKEVEQVTAYDQEGTLLAQIYGMSYATAAVHENLALRYMAAVQRGDSAIGNEIIGIEAKRESEIGAGTRADARAVHENVTGQEIDIGAATRTDTKAVHENMTGKEIDIDHEGQSKEWMLQRKVNTSSAYKIGVLHTNVDGDAGHDNYAPCTKQDLINAGIDYWALGHIHIREVLHTSPYIVYSGNMQGRHSKEIGPKGCYIVDVDSWGESTLTFCPLDRIRWMQEELSIEGVDTVQQLKLAFHETLEQARSSAKDRSVVIRLHITGRGSLYQAITTSPLLQELCQEFREEEAVTAETGANFVWIESIQQQVEAMYAVDQLRTQDSFVGELLRLSDKLMEEGERREDFSEAALRSLRTHTKLAKLEKSITPEQHQYWLLKAQEMALDLLLKDAE